MTGSPIHIVMAARMARDTRHECPIGVCRISLPLSKLTCKGHWFTVPRRLREDVNDAYAYGAGIGSLKLLHAQQAAIDAVEKRLAEEEGQL